MAELLGEAEGFGLYFPPIGEWFLHLAQGRPATPLRRLRAFPRGTAPCTRCSRATSQAGVLRGLTPPARHACPARHASRLATQVVMARETVVFGEFGPGLVGARGPAGEKLQCLLGGNELADSPELGLQVGPFAFLAGHVPVRRHRGDKQPARNSVGDGRRQSGRGSRRCRRCRRGNRRRPCADDQVFHIMETTGLLLFRAERLPRRVV